MVAPGLIAAGMEMVIARLARGLIGRGHDVGITCIEFLGDLGEQLSCEGIRVQVVPLPGLRTILAPTALADWFREIRPDIVHVHSGAWLKAARAAVKADVPAVVHTFHGLEGDEPWYDRHLLSWAARYTDAVIAVSTPLADFIVDRVGVRAETLHVVPNGIDARTFSPGPRSGTVRQRFGLTDDRVVIGHVGRFAPVKNHIMLLDSFRRARDRSPQLFLALVGDGPLRDAIESSAADLGISQHVGFVGQTMDVAAACRDFDIFVLPSHLEGTSISLLEAMATGLAVVATAVGGTPDLLGTDGDTGMLVPPGQPDRLADALAALAADPALRARLGARARERVLVLYAEDAMLDRHEAIYAAATAPSTVTA